MTSTAKTTHNPPLCVY